MGNRRERMRAAGAELRSSQAGPVTGSGRYAGTEPRPSAWRWSRGADIGCIFLLVAMGIGGSVAITSGMNWLGYCLLGGAAVLVLALIIHAATAGRRFAG